MYVADAYNNVFKKFTSSGMFLTQWGTPGFSDGQLRSLIDVAVDSSGSVYVTDYGNNRIQKFTSSGVYVAKWGIFGSAAGN